VLSRSGSYATLASRGKALLLRFGRYAALIRVFLVTRATCSNALLRYVLWRSSKRNTRSGTRGNNVNCYSNTMQTQPSLTNIEIRRYNCSKSTTIWHMMRRFYYGLYYKKYNRCFL